MIDPSWQSVLDAVAREQKWPTSEDVKRLSAKVAALSAAYNAKDAEAPAAARSQDGLAARLLFSFPRDLSKSAAAVRELFRARAFPRPMRVLDVGAGLGAMTWGLVQAGAEVDAILVDDDANALRVAARIAEKRHEREEGDTRARARIRTLLAPVHKLPRETFDLVVMGQVLSELDRERTGEARVLAHRELLLGLLDRIHEHGAVVVVEPALRERTRHLHAVRDALLGAAHVFAPCLHESPCPALATPGDWCHEDRPIDLPPWLWPVARGAGLRWEGLTFSYLVLVKDDRRLVTALALPPGAVRLRVVSDRIVTKGKSEVVLCGEHGKRPKVARLDRSRSAENDAWDHLHRGDLVAIAPPPEPRVEREHRVIAIDVERPCE